MVRICPECQSENEDENDFCKNCGINLSLIITMEYMTIKCFGHYSAGKIRIP